MAKVTGIGGIFFRARDPEALTAWYQRHLGITQPDVAVWMQEAGPTVFSPFRADTDYFAPDRQWMLNLRVDDLPGHDRATAVRPGSRWKPAPTGTATAAMAVSPASTTPKVRPSSCGSRRGDPWRRSPSPAAGCRRKPGGCKA
jgi:hypothetical protein